MEIDLSKAKHAWLIDQEGARRSYITVINLFNFDSSSLILYSNHEMS